MWTCPEWIVLNVWNILMYIVRWQQSTKIILSITQVEINNTNSCLDKGTLCVWWINPIYLYSFPLFCLKCRTLNKEFEQLYHNWTNFTCQMWIDYDLHSLVISVNVVHLSHDVSQGEGLNHVASWIGTEGFTPRENLWFLWSSYSNSILW